MLDVLKVFITTDRLVPGPMLLLTSTRTIPYRHVKLLPATLATTEFLSTLRLSTPLAIGITWNKVYLKDLFFATFVFEHQNQIIIFEFAIH